MKKIIAMMLILSCGASAACLRSDGARAGVSERYTYLVAGIDEAASNTDVLFLASYDVTDNAISVIHIPRDTYARFEGKYGKINRILPILRAGGRNISEAMSELTSYVSRTLAVDIDGYFCVGMAALVKTVDIMGGVDISLDDALTVTDEYGNALYKFERGINHLDGEAAGKFVRFRRGYVTGDLGRIDAQKAFLKAFFESAKEKIGLEEATRIVLVAGADVTTDVGIINAVKILFKIRGSTGKTAMNFATLPGEAVIIDSTSFYIINRKSAAELVFSQLNSNGKFDPDGNFSNDEDNTVKDIYFNENIKFKQFED